MVVSAAQIRAARALVGWTQAQLAEKADLSEISIQQIEKGLTDPRATTLAAIERAFEAAGVEFTNGGRPGVRMVSIAGALQAVANSLMQNPAIFVWNGPPPSSIDEKNRRQNQVEELAAGIKNIAQSAKHDASSLAKYESLVKALHSLGTRVDDNLNHAVHQAFVAAGI
jgi:transcriptional regulator with XRE-family HTH domain